MDLYFEVGQHVFALEVSTAPITKALAIATVSATSTSLDCVDLHGYWKGLATTLFEAGRLTGTVPLLIDGVDRKPQTRSFYIPVAQQRAALATTADRMANVRANQRMQQKPFLALLEGLHHEAIDHARKHHPIQSRV